jgi:type II secretory pathway pseudopilin PulG
MNPIKSLFKFFLQIGILGGILIGMMHMVSQSDQRQAAKLAAQSQQSQQEGRQQEGQGGIVTVVPSPGTTVTQPGDSRIIIQANPTPTPQAIAPSPVAPAPIPTPAPTPQSPAQGIGTPIFSQPNTSAANQSGYLPSRSPISLPSNPQTGQPYRQNGMIWIVSGGQSGWIMEGAIAAPAPVAPQAAQPYQAL